MVRRVVFSFRLDDTVCEVQAEIAVFHVEGINDTIGRVVNEGLCRYHAVGLYDAYRLFHHFAVRLVNRFQIVFHFVCHHMDYAVRGRFCSLFHGVDPCDLFVASIRFLRVYRVVHVL